MIELTRPDGTLKARGKLLADLQDERTHEAYEAWNENDGEFIAPEVTEADLDAYLILHYAECRRASYPPIAMFADAWVKQDEAGMEAYRQACLAVKAKYPKELV